MTLAFQPVVSVNAPAKINLALHVTGRRENGYHDLESLVVFANVGDELHFHVADEDSLLIKGPFGALLKQGQSNLVSDAITAFRQKWPDAVPQKFAVTLEKNLPIAAGIGGGSADAAAALRALVELSQIEIPVPELAELALGLGADVPLCLFNETCIARGLGELVQPLSDFPKLYVVLVNPLKGIATADIFRKLDKRDNLPMPSLPTPLNHALLGLWMVETRNDLEATAVRILPQVGEVTSALRQTKYCIAARMSGSGATVFGLYGSEPAAHVAAQDIRRKLPNYWVATAPIL